MNQQITVNPKVVSLRTLLEASKGQISMALPKHLTADRLLRIAMTEAQSNPALLDCTQVSFIGAIIKAATLGLEPGGALGHCYLVPFNNKKAGTKEVQFIVGYRGMIDLAYRSPKVKKVISRAVYDKDKFFYQFGLDEKLEHTPNQAGEGDQLTHVYCIVELENGIKLFDVMTRAEVEMARKRSKASESGPWETDYEAMSKKSVVRRFFKFMPSSIEMQTAVGMDEAGERGEQNNGAVIEAVGVHVNTKPNTTEKFKENLGSSTTKTQNTISPTGGASRQQMAEEPDPEFGTDENNFDNFTPPTFRAPIQERDKTELVMEVVAAAEKIGIKTLPALSARCMKEFGKKTGDMTGEELEKFLEILEKERK